jgi:hypothetical protein
MVTVFGFASYAVSTARPLVKSLFAKLSRAFAAFAEARVRNAVPDWQMRRARRDMHRLDRLLLEPSACLHSHKRGRAR